MVATIVTNADLLKQIADYHEQMRTFDDNTVYGKYMTDAEETQEDTQCLNNILFNSRLVPDGKGGFIVVEDPPDPCCVKAYSLCCCLGCGLYSCILVSLSSF